MKAGTMNAGWAFIHFAPRKPRRVLVAVPVLYTSRTAAAQCDVLEARNGLQAERRANF
jgi:hypothetical protein